MNEDAVESAALAWFSWLGYQIRRGVDLTQGTSDGTGLAVGEVERTSEDVILFPRLLRALNALNPHLPTDTLAGDPLDLHMGSLQTSLAKP